MGVLTSNRKRVEDPFCTSPSLDLSNLGHISKKLKLSEVGDTSRSTRVALRSAVYSLCLYPEPKQLPRVVHAPTKNSRFGLGRRSWSGVGKVGKVGSGYRMGNFFSSFGALRSKYEKSRREAVETIRNCSLWEGGEGEVEGKKVIVLDDEDAKEDVTGGSSIEELEVEIDVGNEGPVVYEGDVGLKSLSPSGELEKLGKLPHEVLLDSARKRERKLEELRYQIQLKETLLHWHQLERPQKKVKAVKEDEVKEAFLPLSDEDRSEVKRAFANSNRRKMLVSHEKSNIDITGETLQCLRPGAWLNDEVINLYLELLKERENREPRKFLKCHFFNTFFYKKLIAGKGGYNFQAVRRWTTQRKLGYSLSDCDKIFVPIHQEVHWCLAVINKKDQKFQYLDSLGGRDYKVMKVLAMYYADEVKDKTGKIIDVGSWEQEFVEDLPEQENGYDCGVFMIKYADFYSRGVGLRFNQGHMPYFRQRTAKEILRLKAE